MKRVLKNMPMASENFKCVLLEICLIILSIVSHVPPTNTQKCINFFLHKVQCNKKYWKIYIMVKGKVVLPCETTMKHWLFSLFCWLDFYWFIDLITSKLFIYQCYLPNESIHPLSMIHCPCLKLHIGSEEQIIWD